MSPTSRLLPADLAAYLDRHLAPEHPALARLRRETDRLERGGMRSSLAQLQLIALLIAFGGIRRILEVGTFTGYGTLAMALALPDDGRIVTLDADLEPTEIGASCWQEAGVAGRIERRIGQAKDELARLIEERSQPFDLVYIDADKRNYPVYVELADRLLRPGGLFVLDNMFWGGGVLDEGDQSHQTVTLRALARQLADDPSLTASLIPLADGVMIARKRS